MLFVSFLFLTCGEYRTRCENDFGDDIQKLVQPCFLLHKMYSSNTIEVAALENYFIVPSISVFFV
ncbi:hypothetical protein ABFS82_13G170400 [Erythranthe guttata]